MAAGRRVSLLVPLLALAAAAPDCAPRLDAPFAVMRRDEAGRFCWGHIRVMTCRGSCRSHEVPDWRFPFKRSHHPVCIHDAIQLRTVTLEHCDPEAAAGTAEYSYLDALSCKCAVCNSAITSCEGSKYRGTRSWSPGR